MRRFFSHTPPLAWLGLGGAVLILALGWLISLPIFEEGELQGRGGEPKPIPLLPGVTLRAPIQADRPGLSRVRVKVATYMRRNTCTLDASLTRGGEVLAESGLGASWFPDLEWVEIPFYLRGSDLGPGDYEVRFGSPDSDPQNAVAIMGGAGEGEILLRAVYCAGRVPVWTWLDQYRPDYRTLLAVLVLILACGGAGAALGGLFRRRRRGKRPGGVD